MFLVYVHVRVLAEIKQIPMGTAISHGDRHKYAKKSKPRRTRVNLGAAERLSTLLWTPEVDKWTNGGSENELFASR